MNIFGMIKEGLRIARTSRALWLYGFFVGLAAGNGGSRGHRLGTSAATHLAPHAATAGTALLASGAFVLLLAGTFMYFVSAGALIEGVAQQSRGRLPTVRAGWQDGLAHWGVLLRIALVYLAVSTASVLVLAAPSLLSMQLGATSLAVILGIPAALVAAPWLATLYMWQAFAARIAVIENRQARDALLKARLFLHGHLLHGLKLIIAALLGRLIVMLGGSVGLAALGLAAVVALRALGVIHATVPLIALGTMALLPAVFILIAIGGTTQSSIWTLGFIAQQQQ